MFALSSTLAEDGTPDDGTFDQARVAPSRSRSWRVRNQLTRTHPQSLNKKSLLDKFEYVMHGALRARSCSPPAFVSQPALLRSGKVFKIGEDRSSTPAKVEVHASFGGLLMLLKVCACGCGVCVFASPDTRPLQGEPGPLKDLDVDMRVYLLIRKM